MTTSRSTDGTPITVREKTPANSLAVRNVNLAAFGGPAEADLVDKLRSHSAATFSLVASNETQLVGHILFSPVALDPAGTVKGLGLGPVSVLPQFQRHGIGSLLIRHGVEKCRRAGYDFIALLGHPGYYPRFGFVPALKHGIKCEYDAPAEAFMILELRPGALAGHPGTIKYLPEFNEV